VILDFKVGSKFYEFVIDFGKPGGAAIAICAAMIASKMVPNSMVACSIFQLVNIDVKGRGEPEKIGEV